MDSSSVPAEAIRLHELGRAAGADGDSVRALQLLQQAYELAPDWPYPPYDIAFTYLLADYVEQAEQWYGEVDRLSPRGFFTAKTSLHTIRRERRGELPAGFAKAFALLEWADPETRSAALVAITAHHPTFAPAWKEVAMLLDDEESRLGALERGLAADADDETYGVLVTNKALLLRNRGQHADAQALVRELLVGPRCTAGVEGLARTFFAGT